MTLILALSFLALTLFSEYCIYKNAIAPNRRKRWARAYRWFTLIVWTLSLIGFAYTKIFADPGYGFVKVYMVVLLLFIFNGMAKIIFAALMWLGRRTGHPSIMYALATVTVIVLNIIMTYGATTGRWTIREERVDIVSDKVPTSFNGFRIALFSDIHAGRLMDKYQILSDMVSTINSMDVDIAINCGDIVNNEYRELDPQTMHILSGIQATYGVFSVLGNHDMGKYIFKPDELSREENIRLLVERQQEMGWHVLRDEVARVTNGLDTIFITGFDFPQETLERRSSHIPLESDQGYDNIMTDIPHDKFNIVMAHTPHAWDQLLATGKSDLTVSGHVHAFQFRIKTGKGRYWSPARYMHEHYSGLYEQDEQYLYVNDGVGYSMLAMRIWCKPEVTLIELRNK